VADCVQSLGNQIIDIVDDQRPANAPEWPELMPMLMRTVADASKDSGVRSDCLWAVKEMTVSIWQVLVASAGQSQQLLRGCLADPAEGVRGEAASLLCSLVDNIESREERVPFAPLIPDFCTVLTQLAGSADSKHLNTVLQSLQATTETCDFFKNHVASHLMPLLHGVAMSHKDDASRKYALEVIVCFMEAKPKAMVKVPSYVEQTLEVCIRFMMELNEDIAEWAEQDEEDEGEEDEEHYVFGKEAIDRVCRCAHRVDCFPAVLEVLKPAITKLFQTGEWKPVVAAITALSQIAEYVDDEAAVAQMVQGILMQLAASHPRVRHTAWTSIAQFAQDHSETICTEAWVAQLVPKFIAVFDDTCPKVILRSMEAFQHYGESIEREDMEPFVPMLMEKLGVKLQQPLFQKKAITFVAVVASQVGDTFAPYYPQLMPALQAVVQRTLDKVEERMLLGKCFECMSLLGKAVGKEGFKNDAQAFMEAMIRATQVPNLPPTDPVKEYMLAAAERICSTMKDDFLPFVPHVLPSIVEKLTLGPKEWADGLDNLGDLKEGEVDLTLTQENGKVKVLVMYASDKQDLQAALEAVHTFVQELRKGYAPFVAQTAHALLPVFDFSMDEGIRSLAYETWGQLCQCARDGGQVQVASELVMEFLKRILPKFEEAEIDVAALKSRADGVTCCLKKAGPDILSMEQVEHIGSTAMRYLGESLQRRDQAAKGPPPGVQLPEDEDGGRDEEDEAEETNLRVALAEIAGAIMEHHPAAFVQQCFQSYLSLVLRLFESADREDRKLSLFVTCDFLEHLGTRVTTHWPQFMPKLLQDVRHESAELRQPACYGISLAARDPAFSEIAAAAATELVEVITKARQKAKKKSERPAQAVADNALSALVAILLNHQPAVAATEAQLWAVWLGGLPCQVDDEEGERNHKTLLRLVEQEKPEVVGAGGANMPRLLAILVDVYQTDMVDQATSEGIGRLALRVGEAGLEGLAAQFTEKQRKKLLRVVREARKAAGAS